MHVHVLRAAPSHSQFKIVRAPAAGYRPNAVRADLSADLLDYQLILRPMAKRAKGASPGSLNRAVKRKSRFPAISSPSSEVRNVPAPDLRRRKARPRTARLSQPNRRLYPSPAYRGPPASSAPLGNLDRRPRAPSACSREHPLWAAWLPLSDHQRQVLNTPHDRRSWEHASNGAACSAGHRGVSFSLNQCLCVGLGLPTSRF
jgi:hypothetical protein